MKSQRNKEWLWPPPDQWITVWGTIITAVGAILTSQLFRFFSRLSGLPWIYCYAVALITALVGAALLFYAKLPLYRQREFFTFGCRTLPESRRPYYRCGYFCVIFSAALFCCLFLSRP
ncbi:MAG TPA: hypothetical protein VGE41_01215 [Verrucomicrobiae bacterium]|jgi:hypothetical protein